MTKIKSEKFIRARAGLPDNLKPIYDDLVDQYSFHTIRLFGKGYVAYELLATLVREGWRCVENSNNTQEDKQ